MTSQLASLYGPLYDIIADALQTDDGIPVTVSSSGPPTSGQVLMATSALEAEWQSVGSSVIDISAGTGIAMSPNPITNTGTISVANQSGLSPATYTNPSLTVNAQGIITAVTNGSLTPGSVASIAQLDGSVICTPNPITTMGTVSLPISGVTVGSYTNSSFTVNSQGIVTGASSGTAPVTSVTGTSPIVSSGGSTPAISLATSGVTAGSYSYPTLTVTNQGLLSAASSNTPVTSLTAGTGVTLSGSTGAVTISAAGTGGTVTSVTGTSPIVSSGGSTPAISLATSGVTAGSYTNSSVTVNNQGLVTAASSGSAVVTAVTGVGNISSTGGTTPAISISNSPSFSGTVTASTIQATSGLIVGSGGTLNTLSGNVYAPSLSNETGMSGVSNFIGTWNAVGLNVAVAGSFNFQASGGTGAQVCSLTFSLPIAPASNWSSAAGMGGSVSATSTNGIATTNLFAGGIVQASTGSKLGFLQVNLINGATSQVWNVGFSATYQV